MFTGPVSHLVGKEAQGRPASQPKPARKAILDHRRNIETQHPFCRERICFLNIIVDLCRQLPRTPTHHYGLPKIDLQWDGPLLRLPIIGDRRTSPYVPTTTRQVSENRLYGCQIDALVARASNVPRSGVLHNACDTPLPLSLCSFVTLTPETSVRLLRCRHFAKRSF